MPRSRVFFLRVCACPWAALDSSGQAATRMWIVLVQEGRSVSASQVSASNLDRVQHQTLTLDPRRKFSLNYLPVQQVQQPSYCPYPLVP
jgi:hypothetical protein